MPSVVKTEMSEESLHNIINDILNDKLNDLLKLNHFLLLNYLTLKRIRMSSQSIKPVQKNLCFDPVGKI